MPHPPFHAGRVDSLQTSLSAMQAERQGSSGGEDALRSAGGGAVDSAGGGSSGGVLEKKLIERQSRFEGALMQVKAGTR